MNAHETAERATPELRLLPPLRLTVAEVAASTGASERTVQRWCATGLLRCFKVGRLVRVYSDDLALFVRRHRGGDGA